MVWTCGKDGGEELCMCMNVVGNVSRGRPRLIWNAFLQNDVKAKELSRNTAHDQMA